MPQGQPPPQSNALSRLLARALSVWIRPQALPDNVFERIDTTRPILYVLETGGISDRTALSLATHNLGLPAPSTDLHYLGERERSSIAVLARVKRRGWLSNFGIGAPKSANSPLLTRMVAASMSHPDDTTDLQVVPVAIYWGRAPEKINSLIALLFNENWELGGRLAKFVRSLIHGRNTLVVFSKPLSLRTLADSDDTGAPSAALLTRKLSRVLRVHFRKRRVATLGPDRSHRRTLLEQVLTDDGVRKAIVEHAGSTVPAQQEKSRRRARRYAYEIAANVSYPTVNVLDRLFTRLWTELYDGVEIDGIEHLQTVAEGNEIVYVPCHRSHIDYMLLSYILVKQGFSLPHVAAGVNLNLPFIGGVLRRGGAFFLRRSFTGHPLYAAVFNAYLKEIQQRGHAIEYFIEGGRSRSGRLLPAKGGMLAMTTHAYLREPRTPVVFVPVYFGYERLIEGRSFTSELAGGKKRKESILGLLRSLKSLREDYGRVHVNFGETIHLNDVLDTHRPDWRQDSIDIHKPDWLNPIIKELGSQILNNINSATSVTPISLLATAMLATRQGKLDHDELSRQLTLYARLLEKANEDTNIVVPDMDADKVIRHGHDLGYLETHKDAIGDLVAIRSGQAAPLTYFRNNILHLLTLPSLIAAAFSSRARRSDEAIKNLVHFALPFLYGELFQNADVNMDVFEHTLAALEAEGLLQREDDLWRRPAAGSAQAVSLMRLGEVVLPSIERYYLCAALLIQADTPLTKYELAERCADSADRLAHTEGRNAQELHDQHLFDQFLQNLEIQGLVSRNDKLLTPHPTLTNLEREARQLLDDGIRHAILRATRARSRPG